MHTLGRLGKSCVSHSRMCIKKVDEEDIMLQPFSLNLPVPLPITSLLSFINYSTESIQHVTVTLVKNIRQKIFLLNMYTHIEIYINRHGAGA